MIKDAFKIEKTLRNEVRKKRMARAVVVAGAEIKRRECSGITRKESPTLL